MYQGNYTHYRYMLQLFTESIPEEVQSLDAAIREENWKQAASIAHSIKPNFAMVGLDNLYHTVSRLESMLQGQPQCSVVSPTMHKVNRQLTAALLVARQLQKELRRYA